MIVIGSVKRGVGVTTTTALLGLAASSSKNIATDDPVMLIDVDGDLPSAMGLSVNDSLHSTNTGVSALSGNESGINQWILSGLDSPVAALERIAFNVKERLLLVPKGVVNQDQINSPNLTAIVDEQIIRLKQGLQRRPLFIDIGSTGYSPLSAAFLRHADVSLLVVRSCYLALKAALSSGDKFDGAILIEEPGRTLSARDIQDALGIPVVAILSWDRRIARAVDAGTMSRVRFKNFERIMELADDLLENCLMQGAK